MRKVAATFEFENFLWKNNRKFVAGIDEVGRGAWAGPLVSAAVVFPQNFQTKTEYFDSKLLSPKKRENLAEIIEKEAQYFAIGLVTVEEIEQMGLSLATQLSYQRVLEQLNCKPDHFLIDAFYIKAVGRENQTPIVRGDILSASIAAASIIAKVYRDRLMSRLPKSYDHYLFSHNKGYGTKAHQEAILRYGLTDLHRHNYNLTILQ